jgi:hypothetical protein
MQEISFKFNETHTIYTLTKYLMYAPYKKACVNTGEIDKNLNLIL